MASCCKSRPWFLPVAGLCTIALGLHIFALFHPGWIMMKRDLTEIVRTGGFAEHLEVKEDDLMFKPDASVVEEEKDINEWIKESTIDLNRIEFGLHFGLWNARMCVREKETSTLRITEITDVETDESNVAPKVTEETDEEIVQSVPKIEKKFEHRKHEKHCNCKKISTACALLNSYVFEDPINYGGLLRRNEVLSKENFGYASLKEHQWELCLALGFHALALLSSIGGFWKGCRCGATATVLFLLLAAFLTMAPISRFARYSVNKNNAQIPVYVMPPVSVIIAGCGLFVTVIASFVAFLGTMKNFREKRPGNWYRFNNELELPVDEEKKSKLVFVNDPLPPKPGMDVTA
ncbi:uncharacterized protein LOC127863329 [Dreissena polymorpha]|uniref:Transmembrane protein n=1 Tax=Dreissena polymorpha TaxID=45954 RepID=A0A9D3Y5B3_DREPO|nr:uncharacterized protein LOC127863329 [Dreissena polymorpha]XP_052258708.1 uncharacterized protein LOC127863329 [Dreissena polymorpha]XP_052258709.1 uncharacterized protein LOC127863329 [Dreissena polymorpha]XP_052258710.1 uncharacterized protein LOC127863329 [Dreissena polymorpha]KAH3692558.1 hypothetical protein DPMN_193107 [Dreissena polymorpha]KAH3692559.1 hypothetical protein DPMN_193107 [Dreissena polymorpha]